MSQELVAALSAYQLVTGTPLPHDTPLWDGTHINTFLRLKDYFK